MASEGGSRVSDKVTMTDPSSFLVSSMCKDWPDKCNKRWQHDYHCAKCGRQQEYEDGFDISFELVELWRQYEPRTPNRDIALCHMCIGFFKKHVINWCKRPKNKD